MALADGATGVAGPAIKIAIAAEMIYQLVGSNMSSPQTAELNAAARAPTIGKWVNLTNAEAAGWILFLTLVDQSPWWIVGGGLAGIGMWMKYRYAINSGLQSAEPPTERY